MRNWYIGADGLRAHPRGYLGLGFRVYYSNAASGSWVVMLASRWAHAGRSTF